MTRRSLIMESSCFALLLLLLLFVFFSLVSLFLFLSFFPFLSYSYYPFKFSNFLFINSIFHVLTIHARLIIVLLLLLLLLIVIITIIIDIIVMLINITFAAILEKSSGRDFPARNLSGIVYPYLSREVINKPFQRRI